MDIAQSAAKIAQKLNTKRAYATNGSGVNLTNVSFGQTMINDDSMMPSMAPGLKMKRGACLVTVAYPRTYVAVL